MRRLPRLVLGLAVVALASPLFAAESDTQESHNLVIRTAPGVEIFLDASGGPWFLPSGGRFDGAMLGEAHGIHEILWTDKMQSLRPIFPLAHLDEIAQAHRLDRYYVVEFANVESLQDAVLALEMMTFDSDVLEWVGIDPQGTVADVPDDSSFSLQYGLRNTGQPISGQTGTPGSDISVVDAWSWTIGSPNVTVAVLDSGINSHHEFSSRLLPGWNVPAQNDDVHDQCSSHGTHVTGILAASGDNGTGIAGIAWAVKILPVVVLTGCSGSESWCAEGIYWATDNGADLINFSLQYSTGDPPLQDAVAYAHSLGVVQVAAAGNTGSSNDVQAPGRFPETIAVANIDNRDQRQPTSSQGPELDLAAAGWQVYSCINTSGYGYGNGTSMSSPHVAGIAALLRSLVPELTPAEVKEILIQTSEDIAATGFDQQTGYGRPNAWAAIQALGVDPPVPGDLNLDGEVDGIDFGLLLVAWGSCGDCEEAPCPADLNGDCVVNGIDIGLLLVDWGT